MSDTTGSNHGWSSQTSTQAPIRQASADIPARPWMTFTGDQVEVRGGDLLRLAAAVAEVTDPRVQPALAEQDRLLLAMAAPNLPDSEARRRLLDIVCELHQAELAADVDEVEQRDPEYRSPEDYRESAAALAGQLVEADLKAAAVPGLRLVSARNVPMAGAR